MGAETLLGYKSEEMNQIKKNLRYFTIRMELSKLERAI
jgi:hypothetical protein